jgi:hypothetical protein
MTRAALAGALGVLGALFFLHCALRDYHTAAEEGGYYIKRLPPELRIVMALLVGVAAGLLRGWAWGALAAAVYAALLVAAVPRLAEAAADRINKTPGA